MSRRSEWTPRSPGSVRPVHAFTCPSCGALLFFENSRCLACHTEVGYQRSTAGFVCVPPGLRCANAEIAACNWTAPGPDPLCECCQLTRTRPSGTDAVGMAAF